MIVNAKRKKSDKSAGIKLPDILQVLDISYSKIIDYKTKSSKWNEQKKVLE